MNDTEHTDDALQREKAWKDYWNSPSSTTSLVEYDSVRYDDIKRAFTAGLLSRNHILDGKKVEAKEVSQIYQTLSLMRSMIQSGESFTSSSWKRYNTTIRNVQRLEKYKQDADTNWTMYMAWVKRATEAEERELELQKQIAGLLSRKDDVVDFPPKDLCGCGKPTEYFLGKDDGSEAMFSCNPHFRCLTHDELVQARAADFIKLGEARDALEHYADKTSWTFYRVKGDDALPYALYKGEQGVDPTGIATAALAGLANTDEKEN